MVSGTSSIPNTVQISKLHMMTVRTTTTHKVPSGSQGSGPPVGAGPERCRVVGPPLGWPVVGPRYGADSASLQTSGPAQVRLDTTLLPPLRSQTGARRHAGASGCRDGRVRRQLRHAAHPFRRCFLDAAAVGPRFRGPCSTSSHTTPSQDTLQHSSGRFATSPHSGSAPDHEVGQLRWERAGQDVATRAQRPQSVQVRQLRWKRTGRAVHGEVGANHSLASGSPRHGASGYGTAPVLA